MSETGPMDSATPPAQTICPQCGLSLPPQTSFCSACGAQIKKQRSEQRQADAADGDAEDGGDTIRLPSPLHAQLRKSRSFNSIGIADQTSQAIATAPAIEAPPFQETSAVTKSPSKQWGWLPVLSLTSAVGVLLVALACESGRISSPWGEPLFWLGLVTLFLPVAWRVISAGPARGERIALIVMIGIELYLFRILAYPLSFAYNDEFIHWRGAIDLATYGHLFQHPNPLLAVGPFYPGLEIVTNALSDLTGLSIFVSGMVILGVVRLVLVLSLYLFFERLSGSTRAAGIAMLLYMLDLLGTLFAYESLALPLAIFILFAVSLYCYGPGDRYSRRRGLILAICLALAALVVTHHLTAYALVAILLLWTAIWAVVSFYQLRTQKGQLGPSPGGIALLGLVLCIAWVAYVGNYRVVGYLYPSLESTVGQFMQLLAGKARPRQLFHTMTGFVQPLWERVAAFTSVVLIMLGLPFGLFQTWRYHRANPAALALAVAALLFPISLLARLTPAGSTTGPRVTGFVFPAVTFVLAIGITKFLLSGTQGWRRSAVITSAILVIFIGGVVTGTSPLWSRLPGPYLVNADARSIDPESVTAAEWAYSYLGPGHRMATDRTNMKLMATYGDEWIVTMLNDKVDVALVFLSQHFGSYGEALLRRAGVQYLVVDRRLSTALPQQGIYFEETEPNARNYTKPLDPAVLAKFDNVRNVSRIFDSGDIQIYDVKAITRGQSVTTRPQPLCTPGSRTTGSSTYLKVAKGYSGTLYDIPSGITATIALTGIQQRQGAICGYVGGMPTIPTSSGIPANDPFKGTVATNGIQFTLTGGHGQATFSFEGFALADGTITGTYCSLGVVTGKCSDYGLWDVSPAA